MTYWRDVVDELTPHQVRMLERYESSQGDAGELLFAARVYAFENMRVRDAITTSPDIRVAEVVVTGHQFGDGQTERRIALSAHDIDRLTPEQARVLAAALLSAANEVERAS